jgi:CDP-diacylglycerol--inositol 3-phosphatidyltransferase
MAPRKKKASSEMSEVYFFVPNLIGYTRIVLAIISFAYSFTSYKVFFVCYGLSAWLDIADGHAARHFDQVSRYGAVLDMVTDRASTTCLCMVLTLLYEDLKFVFLAAVGLDVMSHFAHLYSSLLRGVGSHKAIDDDQSWLLKIYYTNRLVLGALCFLNETFYITLYVNYWWKDQPQVPVGPIAGLAAQVGDWTGANATDGTIPIAIASLMFVFFPGMLVKNFINVVQLQQASKDIVEFDEQERAARMSKLRKQSPSKSPRKSPVRK